jgi:hypothetical protein
MSNSKPKQVGSVQTIRSNDPPAFQQPFLQTGFDRAREQLDAPPEYFPGSTVVPFAPQTETALQGVEQRATMGSPLTAAGQKGILETAMGGYLGENPALQGAIDAASRGMVRNFQEAVAPGIDSQFSRAGRYGSNMMQNAQDSAQENLATGLRDVASQLAYRDYGAERENMLKAALAAPSIAAMDYGDLAQLERVGAAREGQAADELQDEISRFNFEQTQEQDALDRYMALVAGGQFGSRQTATEPIYQDRTSDALSNIGTAAQIGSSLFGSRGLFPIKF